MIQEAQDTLEKETRITLELRAGRKALKHEKTQSFKQVGDTPALPATEHTGNSSTYEGETEGFGVQVHSQLPGKSSLVYRITCLQSKAKPKT